MGWKIPRLPLHGLCPLILFSALGIASHAGLARADDMADVWRGKSMRFLIGVGAGGDYDVQARLISRYLGKHLPGAPNIIAENMVGAGGLTMTNYLYNIAPKDGSVIGVIPNNFPALQAAGGRGVQFDARQFNWIGAITSETETMVVWKTTGVKNIEDARRVEIIAGASGRGAITYTFPAMMNELIGTKFKIVTGYAGGNAINLAMERGEVEARINSWSSWKVTKPEWVKSGAFVVIAQGARRNPELGDIPSVIDLAREGDDREVVRMITLGAALGRPVTAPPGVPEDRVAALREAFVATTKDPGLLAEATAMRLDIEPLHGQDMQHMISQVLSTPARVAARAKEFLE